MSSMSAKQTQPIPPLDASGTRLVPGMLVRVLTIPEWLTHDLPEEEVRQLKAVEGTVRQISEIDAGGYIWLEGWFCLKPNEVKAEKR